MPKEFLKRRKIGKFELPNIKTNNTVSNNQEINIYIGINNSGTEMSIWE